MSISEVRERGRGHGRQRGQPMQPQTHGLPLPGAPPGGRTGLAPCLQRRGEGVVQPQLALLGPTELAFIPPSSCQKPFPGAG